MPACVAGLMRTLCLLADCRSLSLQIEGLKARKAELEEHDRKVAADKAAAEERRRKEEADKAEADRLAAEETARLEEARRTQHTLDWVRCSYTREDGTDGNRDGAAHGAREWRLP